VITTDTTDTVITAETMDTVTSAAISSLRSSLTLPSRPIPNVENRRKV
jgi:hypothetical protein